VTQSWELDHVFVAVEPGAPELDGIRAAGFAEGPANTHPGQGTACRRVFFENAYLELIWLEDAADASAPGIRGTGLAARAGLEAGASRLGVAFRPSSGRPGPAEPPIRTWRYRPPYLPEGMAIRVAVSSTRVKEPLIFFLPWERRWSAPRIPHPNGARAVTRVTVREPGPEPPSPELRWLAGRGDLTVETGPREALEIELDGAPGGRALDPGPATPITLRW
jgi:hypothetical protein